LVNLQTVHTKALSQIQEAILKYNFEIIHQKGSEMPACFLSQNVVSQLHQNRINSLKFDDQKLELDEVQEPWIKDIKDWMMTGSE
jgi:glutaredoxin-related protein